MQRVFLLSMKSKKEEEENNIPYLTWTLNFKGRYFFWVNPGQSIWPVTRSLDQVDHQVGFQNYANHHPYNPFFIYIYIYIMKEINIQAKNDEIKLIWDFSLLVV